MKKILIVVDMQNDFVYGTLGSDQAVSIVPNVCEKIKNHKGKIYVTKDTHYENYLSTNEGKNLPVLHCIKNSNGWQLVKDIEEALINKDYKIIEKNAFASLELPQVIKTDCSDGDFEIEIIGLCTDICVVSNAIIMKSFFPECNITVDSSCCAGVTLKSHNEALETMKMCQIKVV